MRIARSACLVGVLAGLIGTRAQGAPSRDSNAAIRTAGAAPNDTSSDAPPEGTADSPAMAIGINTPLLWSDSIGASAYLGVLEHHAIRLNFATYQDTGHAAERIGVILGGDGESHLGRVTDLGVAWVFYPQRRWNGVMVEIGALRRARDVGSSDDGAQIQKRSTVYAGRAMVGYSVTFLQLFFAAAAAGISVGYESGTEHTVRELDGAMTSTRLGRRDVTGEAYLRFGIVFGA